MALLGAICTQFPDAQLAIIFLPFFTFSAKSVNIVLFFFYRRKKQVITFYFLGSYRDGVL
jgi:hypothetical protein